MRLKRLGFDIDMTKVPSHMVPGVYHYLDDGVEPGGFLRAVLENKLVESFSLADGINHDSMSRWASFLYNDMPMASWGSEEKVREWIKDRREANHPESVKEEVEA